MLRTKTANIVLTQNLKKSFTTTLYVVAGFYNPFSGRAIVPVFLMMKIGGEKDEKNSCYFACFCNGLLSVFL